MIVTSRNVPPHHTRLQHYLPIARKSSSPQQPSDSPRPNSSIHSTPYNELLINNHNNCKIGQSTPQKIASPGICSKLALPITVPCSSRLCLSPNTSLIHTSSPLSQSSINSSPHHPPLITTRRITSNSHVKLDNTHCLIIIGWSGGSGRSLFLLWKKKQNIKAVRWMEIVERYHYPFSLPSHQCVLCCVVETERTDNYLRYDQ